MYCSARGFVTLAQTQTHKPTLIFLIRLKPSFDVMDQLSEVEVRYILGRAVAKLGIGGGAA
jgi:hypothetical protein